MKKISFFVLMISLITGLVFANGSTEAAAGSAPKKVTIVMRNVNNGGAESVDNDKVYEYIKEQSGIDFEVYNMPNSNELGKKINLSLAGEEAIDSVQTSYKEASMINLQARGALLPLKDLLQEHAPTLYSAFTEEQWKAVTDSDGEIWAIPRQQGSMGYAIAIRKDWREKIGMDKPETIEELEAYLMAVKNMDLDGNGKNDTIPLLSVKGFNEMEAALGYSILGVPVLTGRTAFANYEDEKGNIVPIALHPRYKDYLETLSRWYANGLLHPDQYLLQKAQAQDLIIGNRVAAHAGWYSNFIRPWDKLLANDPNAVYEYVAIKTYDGGDYKVTRGFEANPGMSLVSYSENAVETLKLYEWMVENPTNYITTRYGLEGVHWEWADKENMVITDLRAGEGIYDSAYQLIYYDKFFPNVANEGDNFVKGAYREGMNWMEEVGFVWNPDYYVIYDTKGTEFENTKADADALLDEVRNRIIIGEQSIDEWDNFLATYKELYADEFMKYAKTLYK
ncbi:MAG: extracellular solute-binding protein [Spirochaetales bacterium]|nr:extracellular solute-binding protein [Spirochaetales bacterium]